MIKAIITHPELDKQQLHLGNIIWLPVRVQILDTLTENLNPEDLIFSVQESKDLVEELQRLNMLAEKINNDLPKPIENAKVTDLKKALIRQIEAEFYNSCKRSRTWEGSQTILFKGNLHTIQRYKGKWSLSQGKKW